MLGIGVLLPISAEARLSLLQNLLPCTFATANFRVCVSLPRPPLVFLPLLCSAHSVSKHLLAPFLCCAQGCKGKGENQMSTEENACPMAQGSPGAE